MAPSRMPPLSGLRSPDCWTMCWAGTREQGAGRQNRILLFLPSRAPQRSSPCVPQRTPARKGLAFEGPTPLKGAQTKTDSCPRPQALPPRQAGSLVSEAGQGITSRKSSLGSWGHRRSRVSLLQARRPIPEPTWPRTGTRAAPKGGPGPRVLEGQWEPPPSDVPVSRCTPATAVSPDVGVTEPFRPTDGSQLSPAETPEGFVVSLRNSWPPFRACCRVCSPGRLPPSAAPSPQGHRRSGRDKASGLCSSCVSPRPQPVKCRQRGPPRPACRGADGAAAARGPPTVSRAQIHRHTRAPSTGGCHIHHYPRE